MGLGAVLEPSIVIFLLFGGTWINRAHPHTTYNSNNASEDWRNPAGADEGGSLPTSRHGPVFESDTETDTETQMNGKFIGVKHQTQECAADSSDSGDDASGVDAFDHDNDVERALSSSLLPHQESTWHTREVAIFGWRKKMITPNTARFRNHLLSRLLARFPFLVEAWYWALVYWIYQLGRAFTALTLQESTVNVARKHALQIIELEKSLRIFIEPA
ncbi:hypothetical protein KEM56_002822, partial [Ascosphaera pollenicola]